MEKIFWGTLEYRSSVCTWNSMLTSDLIADRQNRQIRNRKQKIGLLKWIRRLMATSFKQFLQNVGKHPSKSTSLFVETDSMIGEARSAPIKPPVLPYPVDEIEARVFEEMARRGNVVPECSRRGVEANDQKVFLNVFPASGPESVNDISRTPACLSVLGIPITFSLHFCKHILTTVFFHSISMMRASNAEYRPEKDA